MSDAPERIWASVDPMYPEHHGGFWWGESCRGTEYRRADIPPTFSQAIALPEVRELVEALGHLVALNEEYAPFGGEIFQDRVDRTWESARAALHRIGETK